jgi:hypothetical protein
VRIIWASSPRQRPSNWRRPNNYGPDRIVRSTAEDFDAGEYRWDCIVFNEVLYYAPRPLALVDKYSKLIRPGGVMI